MVEHAFSFVVEARPEEIWPMFWQRRDVEHGDVSIEILHPGDEVGNGLVRHCRFRVPWWCLSGGWGHSYEWLTEVEPPKSWRYDAVGKPLWSKATGRTRLEDLGDGRTRVHFEESYHVFNPLLRRLLERRMHRFISRDNDRLIQAAIEGWVEARRASRTPRASAPAER